MSDCYGCRETRAVRVRIAPDLSYTGEWREKDAQIDKCVADLVGALQAAGIDMRASCCGHGHQGSIVLQDGRELIVVNAAAALTSQENS